MLDSTIRASTILKAVEAFALDLQDELCTDCLHHWHHLYYAWTGILEFTCPITLYTFIFHVNRTAPAICSMDRKMAWGPLQGPTMCSITAYQQHCGLYMHQPQSGPGKVWQLQCTLWVEFAVIYYCCPADCLLRADESSGPTQRHHFCYGSPHGAVDGRDLLWSHRWHHCSCQRTSIVAFWEDLRLRQELGCQDLPKLDPSLYLSPVLKTVLMVSAFQAGAIILILSAVCHPERTLLKLLWANNELLGVAFLCRAPYPLYSYLHERLAPCAVLPF